MATLVWDAPGTHFYETGSDHAALYPINMADGSYGTGVAWNGLTGVDESPEGGDTTEIWADDIKYAGIRAAEKAGGTIKAYTYPDEFGPCDGSVELVPGMFIGQQPRQSFGFCYRTRIGNELNPEYGNKLHIFYGCTCSPSSRSYGTVNDSPDAIEMSWDFEANAVPVTDHKPTATIVIDMSQLSAAARTAIENALYGGDNSDPELPTPDELKALIQNAGGNNTGGTTGGN